MEDVWGTWCTITPWQSGRVLIAELWSISTFYCSSKNYNDISCLLLHLDARNSASYWTRYSGGMIACTHEYHILLLYNKRTIVLVTCSWGNDWSHQKHLHPFFPLTKHNSIFGHSNMLISACNMGKKWPVSRNWPTFLGWRHVANIPYWENKDNTVLSIARRGNDWRRT